MECPKCKGGGRVVIQSRMPKRRDREAYLLDEPIECPLCGGTGAVPEADGGPGADEG